MINVLCIEDYPVVRRGLTDILRDAPVPVKVGEARNAEEAFQQIGSTAWDLITLDILLPDMNGLDILKHIRSEWPNLPVIMLSMYTDPITVEECLAAGASGYVTKQSAPDELWEAVEAVLKNGAPYLSRDLRGKVR
jgi:two-component system, NarL family, invasion response regulator UvrY